MQKDIVLNQKRQKEQLLAVEYVPRTKDQFGKKWLDSSLIKVVLGPRRAGKSYPRRRAGEIPARRSANRGGDGGLRYGYQQTERPLCGAFRYPPQY